MFTQRLRLQFLGRRSARAFTLGETMITVAIVGAFLVLVLMRYTHPLAVGQANSAGLELSQIAAALDSYSNDQSAGYPASGSVTPALFGGSPNQYFNNTPKTTGGVGYSYTAPSGSSDYSVCTTSTIADGSAIQMYKKTDGTTPVAGTAYKLCISPTYGTYAL